MSQQTAALCLSVFWHTADRHSYGLNLMQKMRRCRPVMEVFFHPYVNVIFKHSKSEFWIRKSMTPSKKMCYTEEGGWEGGGVEVQFPMGLDK